MGRVSIAGLDKAAVLAALYNSSHPLGMGFLQATPEDMTRDEAAELLPLATRKYGEKESIYFDYLKGRVMKVELANDEVDPALYDRDNGPGALAAVVAKLRKAVA